MLPQYNQSFKKKCRSDLSVQRVADYTFLRFNGKKLQTLQEALDAKEARFRQSKAEDPGDPSLKHAGIHFYHERRKLSAAIEQY